MGTAGSAEQRQLGEALTPTVAEDRPPPLLRAGETGSNSGDLSRGLLRLVCHNT